MTRSSTLTREIASVFRTVEQRTISFFRSELELVPERVDHQLHYEWVTLREMTAIVGVGSGEGVYVAFSYDERLVRAMMRRYTAELVVRPDEETLYMRETASDVVNVIVGNCTTDLEKQGKVIALSPPVLALGARTIQGRPKTASAVLTLSFADGTLDIAFVGPKVMFDETLNYVGERV